MARFETGRLWLADHGLAAGGLTLLLLGATVAPSALPPAWAALALAFFGWVAEADGVALPRPGRLPIRPVGCWETPLAFTVRRGDVLLFFSREGNAADGGWSEEYTIRERPFERGAGGPWELPVLPRSGWSARGRTPVAGLRFEHHERVSYVGSASLARALARAGA